MLFGMSMIAFSSTAHPTPRLLWNASASVPIGLYAIHPAGKLTAGELLVITPPAELAQFMAARRYLALGVPLIKHVAGLPGQIVCRSGLTITVNGIAEAQALDRDARGRKLPVWQGCRTVRTGEVFLMNAGVPDSFDGRYFGPVPDSTIIGSATPLWLPRKQSSRNAAQ
ncbi:MAG: S26 family signal peptidase [Rhodospirillales bacterium 20-58-10]|nr:MAG: S26 family signal peptidase [Rhodospirillales bacterium 20-58-10]